MSHSSFLILDEDAWEATEIKKKKFLSPLSSLLHASSFLILKKTALSLLSHFVLIPQPQRRCRQEREKSLWKKEKK
jgi:hypothetical protein